MKENTHSRRLILGALLGCGMCAVYWPLSVDAEESVANLATGPSEIFGSSVVDSRHLEHSRGRADLNIYDIKSDGVVRDNQAYNLSTGSNWVTDGSLAGMSGFATLVQNSGNNVLIQNATIINLQVK